jgi:hypothetical protein
MQWMMVHRDHAEQVIISLGNGLARPMAIHIADLKIF